MFFHSTQNPGSLLHFPSTPTSSSHRRYSSLSQDFRPINSSPLVSPSSSPVAAAQARRRSQYKARVPSTPTTSSSYSSRTINSSGGSVFGDGGSTPGPTQDPQKAFLREKFKAKCFARAAKAREKAIRGKRYAHSELSSDGFDEAMDEDENEEDDDHIMQDELFRRIMANATRKERHSYRLSYAHEVGSSFDPDMYDIDEWEQELTVDPSQSAELTPIDLDDEELEAYAEECVKRAALADFEDISQEELFNWDDLEELHDPSCQDEDIEMMS